MASKIKQLVKKKADTTDDKSVVTIQTRILPEGEAWVGDNEIAARIEGCEKGWLNLTDEQRAASLMFMVDILTRMTEDPDLWVPRVFKLDEKSNRVEIFIGFHMEEVDASVVEDRLQAERERNAARLDLEQMQVELSNGKS